MMSSWQPPEDTSNPFARDESGHVVLPGTLPTGKKSRRRGVAANRELQPASGSQLGQYRRILDGDGNDRAHYVSRRLARPYRRTPIAPTKERCPRAVPCCLLL